jgi:CRP-like cAMP-binding protein
LDVNRGAEHSLIKALRAVPHFAVLDDRTLLEIVGCSVNLLWRAGSLVFEKDLPAETLFIVLAGRVQIFDVIDGREEEIVVVSPGDYFGELSLLLDARHSKNARALEDIELLAIPKAPFQDIVRAHPELAGHLETRLRERLPDGDQMIERLGPTRSTRD